MKTNYVLNERRNPPPWWSSIDTGRINPYTCRLLIRIDELLYRIRGRPTYWSSDGVLCEHMPAGHGVELRSHFPDSWFVWAAGVQNRSLWTRKVLSL